MKETTLTIRINESYKNELKEKAKDQKTTLTKYIENKLKDDSN